MKNNLKLSKEEQKNSKKDFKDKYFIKDIENLTGIKAFTLRIWEQRYHLIIPKRTDTNIRYYEDADLKYMMNISILNNHGFKISQIAKMSRQEVQEKTLEISESSQKYELQIQGLSQAMLAFNEREFNKSLSICILKLGMEETMEQIIFPFLHHVGVLWLSGSIHVAHEHFITNLIRQRLYVAIDQLAGNATNNAEKYLLFVPNGENHDLGLLFASYLLRLRGQHVIYLGTSTPMEDLNQIFSFHAPDVVFTSITSSQQHVPIEVLVRSLGRIFSNAQVWITGNEVLRKKQLGVTENSTLVKDVSHFKMLLEQRMHSKND